MIVINWKEELSHLSNTSLTFTHQVHSHHLFGRSPVVSSSPRLLDKTPLWGVLSPIYYNIGSHLPLAHAHGQYHRDWIFLHIEKARSAAAAADKIVSQFIVEAEEVFLHFFLCKP
jgi:hypothetical protein